MKGKVIKYNQKNINTDQIIPARYLVKKNIDFLAKHCMEDLDHAFVDKVKSINYSILVTDTNFGCGSSREQAPLALKECGIKCVIAPSFARIFFRNSINIGLQLLEFQSIDLIKTGDILEIYFNLGEIKNISSLMVYIFKKQPDFLREVITEGGLVNYTKKNFI
ncbi:MAG: 3-isopropylmalate dehydratase small subunit [Candidatus Hermodarchaeota archaeon]